MLRYAVALALVLRVAPAAANGRPPVTNGVYVHPRDPQSILVRTTFGLLVSRDGGCSFRWICEQNVGYGGTFDPEYAIASDGAIFATSLDGLRVSRDGGCTFTTATAELPASDPNRIADVSVETLSIAPNGDIWVATDESARTNDVYRSTDNGMTFTPRGMASPTIWWNSVAVAPSDPMRVYLAGYEPATDASDAMGSPRAHLFTTDDAGATWTELPLTNVAFGFTPTVKIAAIDPADPRRVYLRSVQGNTAMPMGDRLYRSTDAGATFTEVLATTAPINDVVIRDATTVLAAAGVGGSFRSDDAGATFAPVAAGPQLGCLAKGLDNALLGCGANWDPDFMAVARSADATAWQKIFRFVELAGPVECAAGTPQFDVCEPQWPPLREQFGVKGPTDPACSVPMPDMTPPPKSGSGCCETDSSASLATTLLSLGILVLVTSRRSLRARS